MDHFSGICWECKAVMLRFARFKMQVVKAQEALSRNKLNNLSTLACQNKYVYDLEIQYNDPLTSIETECKEVLQLQYNDPLNNIESERQLEEEKNNAISMDEGISDVNITEMDECANTDNIKMKHKQYKEKCVVKKINRLKADNMRSIKATKRKKHISRKGKQIDKKFANAKHKIDDDEVKQKYTKVVFTEEEMLRRREEKRKQPNFKKIPYKCDSCVLGFTRKETYDLHIAKRHDEKIGTLVCDVCRTRFATGKSLERHRTKHYVVHRCRLCDYESLELWSAAAHCRSKHGCDTRERIHCPQCETVVRSPGALTEHMRTQHTVRCSQCGDKFKGKDTLRRHKIRVHGANREFSCDVCAKTFMTRSRLETHATGHSSTLARNLAYCAICDVQYKNIYVYRNHLKNSANHSERAYECTECNKKFASKVYWRQHSEFYHQQKSRFKCEICNKIFISDWRLKNHKQTRHGLSRPRNHACNICGKKFFTLAILRGHQLTHSEQRTYMCEDCGDTFKQRPALYTHTRLVHRRGGVGRRGKRRGNK